LKDNFTIWNFYNGEIFRFLVLKSKKEIRNVQNIIRIARLSLTSPIANWIDFEYLWWISVWLTQSPHKTMTTYSVNGYTELIFINLYCIVRSVIVLDICCVRLLINMSISNVPKSDGNQSRLIFEQTERNVNDYINHVKKSEWAYHFNRIFISPGHSFNVKYIIKVL